ncbi:hypothetical protein LJC24_04130, partial [Desulfococcaceae bacterium OttesenSCG-928-F15]|nr:hypothetical protein [Desulfococcaceae bacterium OttesenSCG-928-F15]
RKVKTASREDAKKIKGGVRGFMAPLSKAPSARRFALGTSQNEGGFGEADWGISKPTFSFPCTQPSKVHLEIRSAE